MKNFFSTLLFLASALGVSAQAGLLDTSFDTDGKVNIGGSNQVEQAKAVVVQPDGKIIAAGRATVSGIYDVALMRLHPDGALDQDFGTAGKVTTAVGLQNDEAYAVALQPDGKIVVAGRSFNGVDFDFAIVRYHSDGTLDSSFDAEGIVTMPLGPGNDEAHAVAIQADGKIVVAGYAGNGTDADFALVRYQTDGVVDSSFGLDGVVRTDFSMHDDKALAMRLQSDGKIVAAGWSFNGTNEDFAVARYLSSGILDSTFHNDGRQTTDFTISLNVHQDYGEALVIQPNGMIVVAGYSIASSTQKIISLARYQINGDLDNDFGSGGKKTASVFGVSDMAHAVTLQLDGKIVVAGSAYIPIYEHFDFALLRFNSNGSLDQNFDSDGKVTTDFGVTNDQALAITIQPDGKILVVGDNNIDFALARYLSGLDVGVSDFSIAQQNVLVYPNPVQDNAVTLTYTLSEAEQLAIELFDQQGKFIQTLMTRTEQQAGEHQVNLRLPNELDSGVYLIALSASSGQALMRIVR